MKFNSEVTDKITHWKEKLTALPTDVFLDYARMFLGEISTPFNKQNLVTQVAVFFCQEENKKNAIALMGKNDLKILSLVKLIPESTKKSITEFFSDEADSFTIRAHLQNLEERFILYSYKSNSSGKTVYAINPIIEDALGSKIGMNVLIEKSSVEKHPEPTPISLSPIFLASFISFSLYHSGVCKTDGTLKKKAAKDFAEICGLDEASENSLFSNSVEYLVSAFRNLMLYEEKDGMFAPNWQRLNNFARLPEISQYIYLCSGVFWTGHSHRSLNSSSQLLLDTLISMQDHPYTRKMILRMGSLINTLVQDSDKPTRRFELLISKTTNEEIDFSPIGKLDQLLDTCIAFGLIERIGTDENDRDVFQTSNVFRQALTQNAANQKCISVESGFSVTVMPGLSLGQILPMVKFMDIKRLDVAAVFEINHKSVLRSFDLGMDLDSIQKVLEENSGYSIPQNLSVSLEDWFNTYSSATLYHGYVLKLNESNMSLAEKNRVLAPHIIAKLAPGVLLLDFKDDMEASAVVLQSGLTFIGKVKTCSKENEIPMLPFLKKNQCPISSDEGFDDIDSDSKNECETILQSMKDSLEKMDLPQEQKDGLLSRIERRVIVNKSQLQGTTVHFDKTEASAMDNAGKNYIIEKAITEENLVEITMDLKALPYVGLPVNLDKKNGTVTIRQKNGNEITLPVSAAVKIKKIRVEFQF